VGDDVVIADAAEEAKSFGIWYPAAYSLLSRKNPGERHRWLRLIAKPDRIPQSDREYVRSSNSSRRRRTFVGRLHTMPSPLHNWLPLQQLRVILIQINAIFITIVLNANKEKLE
jgi:hypothetical protein